MNADDKRTIAMAAAGLLEPHDYMHLLRRPRPKRKRRPTLAAALREARKAGITVAGATVETGKVTLTFGKPEPTEASNPWLADLEQVGKQ